jgi:hypothetical protein
VTPKRSDPFRDQAHPLPEPLPVPLAPLPKALFWALLNSARRLLETAKGRLIVDGGDSPAAAGCSPAAAGLFAGFRGRLSGRLRGAFWECFLEASWGLLLEASY